MIVESTSLILSWASGVCRGMYIGRTRFFHTKGDLNKGLGNPSLGKLEDVNTSPEVKSIGGRLEGHEL